MAKGNYPLNRSEGAGARIAAIVEDLRVLLESRGNEDADALPRNWKKKKADEIARDAEHEMRIKMARDLLERCLERG